MADGKKNYNKLLTIAIPTYNRAHYLDLCLRQIARQYPAVHEAVEVLVSNNRSTDNTDDVVENYRDRLAIRYFKNKENIGAERNLVQCFIQSSGKYILILSDDDLLLDGTLERLITYIRQEEYGIVYINACSYKENFISERPTDLKIGRKQEYSDIKVFLKRIHYFFTFISGNVVNRSLIDPDFNPANFLDTNIVQLGWTFSALFRAKKNLYVEEIMISAKTDNSGGYLLGRVFGTNMNRIFRHFIERGVPPDHFDIINRALASYFFPWHIFQTRRKKENFLDEDYFHELFPVFKSYWQFWIYTVPNIYLPTVWLGSFKNFKLGLLRLWATVHRD
jgi:abequosyltransferase